MRETDIICVGGALQQRDSYHCLLTDRPCGVLPVTLRRMFLIPPVWFGRKAVVALPFEQAPSLAIWQYLRMVRWIIMLLIAPSLAALVMRLFDKPSVGLIILFIALIVIFCLAVWFGLGAIIDAREVVRLLTYNQSDNTVTLRFNSLAVAKRAREVLIEKEAGYDFAV